MLAEAVRHEARMSAPVQTGGVVRDHVAAAVARGMVPESELYGPEIPDAVEYLWRWHFELQRGRAFDGATGRVQPLGYRDVEAWARLMGRRPSPDDVDALLHLDAVARNPDAKEA